jgi:hypothetical protein
MAAEAHPSGCNMLFAFRTNRASEDVIEFWNRRYCTPLGCGSAADRFYKYATPSGGFFFSHLLKLWELKIARQR